MKAVVTLLILLIPYVGFGQNVNIPDANFKTYLVGNSAINTNGDFQIQVSEAASFNGEINCYNMNISDLTGVESFTDLTNLTCSNNQLTILDVSTNTALTFLYCLNNQLINLDLRNGNNTEMTVSLTDNPDLICINVDDSQWSSENWFEIDTQHLFSEDCNMTSLDDLKLNNKIKISEFDLFGRMTNVKNQPVI